MILSLVIAVKDCQYQLNNSYDRFIKFESKNIEILLVYDFDDVKTSEVVFELSRTIKNLRPVCSSKKGLYNALNSGIDAATGIFIFFLGIDDDFDLNCYLEKVGNILQDSPNVSLFLLPVKIGNSDTGRLRYPSDITIPAVLHHQSIIFNTHCIRSNNIYYDTKYKIHSDFDFIQRVLMTNEVNINYLNCSLVTFKKGGLSTSRSNLLSGSIELLVIFNKYKSLLTIKCFLAISRKFYYLIASLFKI